MGDLEQATGVAFWTLFLAVLVFSVGLAVLFTWPVCALVLAVYRRSVRSGMRTAVGAAGAPEVVAAAITDPPPRIAVTELADGPPPPLVVLAHRRARRAQLVFAGRGWRSA